MFVPPFFCNDAVMNLIVLPLAAVPFPMSLFCRHGAAPRRITPTLLVGVPISSWLPAILLGGYA
jgi:hypothetical protein